MSYLTSGKKPTRHTISHFPESPSREVDDGHHTMQIPQSTAKHGAPFLPSSQRKAIQRLAPPVPYQNHLYTSESPCHYHYPPTFSLQAAECYQHAFQSTQMIPFVIDPSVPTNFGYINGRSAPYTNFSQFRESPPSIRTNFEVGTSSVQEEYHRLHAYTAPQPDRCVDYYDYADHDAATTDEEGIEAVHSKLVYELTDQDVLCGRGAPSQWHPGNQYFRQLVADYQPMYVARKRADKPEIALLLVDRVKARGGRFLKRTKRPGIGPCGHFCWINIGDQRAYEKCCQSLREGAPELRKKLASRELIAAARSSTPASAAESSESYPDEKVWRNNGCYQSVTPEWIARQSDLSLGFEDSRDCNSSCHE
jgi:hypothetical protein